MNDLKNVKGLYKPIIINDMLKKEIRLMEKRNNLGVMECLNRSFCLFVLHDSDFREPISKIVVNDNGRVIFPAVGFPEVQGMNVVSSSPSLKVHKFLSKKLGLNLKEEEASLLLGFDLQQGF